MTQQSREYYAFSRTVDFFGLRTVLVDTRKFPKDAGYRVGCVIALVIELEFVNIAWSAKRMVAM